MTRRVSFTPLRGWNGIKGCMGEMMELDRFWIEDVRNGELLPWNGGGEIFFTFSWVVLFVLSFCESSLLSPSIYLMLYLITDGTFPFFILQVMANVKEEDKCTCAK